MQAWCPYLKRDIELLEKVQHRANKMMTDWRDKTYEDRLRALHLTTLETRCIRGDLIKTFKIIKGHVDVDYSTFFSLSGGILRGYFMKLFKPRYHTNLHTHKFSNRVVDLWNDLEFWIKMLLIALM